MIQTMCVQSINTWKMNLKKQEEDTVNVEILDLNYLFIRNLNSLRILAV